MLSLRLVGTPRLVVDGRDASACIQYRKGWALVAYLAVERTRRHSREHVAQLLWPALAPAAARNNLRQVIANLNRAFEQHGGAGWLDPARDALSLLPEAEVDVTWLEEAAAEGIDSAGIERAEAWVSGMDGELLGGLGFADCPEYEEWLQDERRRLAATAGRALDALLDAQHAAGTLKQAVETAQRLVALDPWDERRVRRLMSLLAEDGRQEQATVAFERLRAGLRADMDADPEPATRELAEAIAARAKAGVPPHAGAGLPRGAGERRWMGAVYCQWRGEDPAALADVASHVEHAGGRMLAPTARGLLAYFTAAPGAHGPRSVECQAARMALRLRAAFGERLAQALCSGLSRIDPHHAAPALVGNPVEWVFDLCARAAPGQVLTCDAIAEGLRTAFALTRAGEATLPGIEPPIALWVVEEEADVVDVVDRPADAMRAATRDDHDTDRLRRRSDLHTEPCPRGATPRPDASAMAWLTVVEGEDQGKRVELGERPLVLGRATDSDLQIAQRTVSRHHCVVWVDGRDYRLRDLGATNRTRVNGAGVQDVRLHHGDAIALGDCLLRFEREPDPPTVPVRRAG